MARESIDDLDDIARGGCGWGDGILAHVWLYRRSSAGVEHFFHASRSESRQMAMRTLVLGCATGIGNAGARLLAARGDRLALGDIDGPGVRRARGRARRLAVPRRRRRSRRFAGHSSMPRPRRSGGLDYVWSNVGVQIAGSVEQASVGGLRPLVRDQRARARGRVRRGSAAPARCRRWRDLHHGLQLRAALGAEARAVRGHEGRGARARAPGRPRLQRRGDPRQRALPGLDRHALQHAVVGELRRPRALPRGGAAARPARAHRHARGGRRSWPASCSRTTRRT